MDADQLFIRTLIDLEKRVAAADEYEVLLSAGLLRKLLMDQTPLMDKVNSAHRLRIRFRINGESSYERLIHEDEPMYWSLEDAIDPEIMVPPGMRAPLDAPRDQFLARPVLRVHGSWVTVRDLIDQLAHIEGAVHSLDPKNDREEMLQRVARQIYIGGLPAGMRQVQSIGRVVMRALTPLRVVITSVTAPSVAEQPGG